MLKIHLVVMYIYLNKLQKIGLSLHVHIGNHF